jgi:hypothetical protein
LQICSSLTGRASYVESSIPIPPSHEDWMRWTWENIRTLWEEESRVALAVAQSVMKGEEF